MKIESSFNHVQLIYAEEEILLQISEPNNHLLLGSRWVQKERLKVLTLRAEIYSYHHPLNLYDALGTFGSKGL